MWTIGNQTVRRLDPWEIAAQICKLSEAEREERINHLDTTPIHKDYSLPQMVRSWLKMYDNDEIDTRHFLNKLSK